MTRGISTYWKAIVGAATGTSHLDEDKPYQDYGYYIQCGDYLIGAVADGAGSYGYSQEGSQFAVTATLAYIQSMLQKHENSFVSEERSRSEFVKLINYLRDEFGKKATELSNYYHKNILVKELSCTLLVFIASPSGIAAMQLGDGFTIVRYKQRQNYELLFAPSKGEHNNETVFITSPPSQIEQALKVIYSPYPVSFVCASTDGLEDVALEFTQLSQYVPYHNFFVPLERYMHETLSPGNRDDYYLRDFLNSEKVNQKTDDDKTILLCLAATADLYPELQKIKPTPSVPMRLPSSRSPQEVLGSRAYEIGGGMPVNPAVAPLRSQNNPWSSNPVSTPQTSLEPVSYPQAHETLIPENLPKPKKTKNIYLVPIRMLLLSFSLLYILAVFVGYFGNILQNYMDLGDIHATIGVGRFFLGSVKAIGPVIWLFCAIVATLFCLDSIKLLRGKTEWNQPEKFHFFSIPFPRFEISRITILKLTTYFMPLITLVFAILTIGVLDIAFPFTVCRSMMLTDPIAFSPIPICVPDNIFNSHETRIDPPVNEPPTEEKTPPTKD